jgi:hypothetical protein
VRACCPECLSVESVVSVGGGGGVRCLSRPCVCSCSQLSSLPPLSSGRHLVPPPLAYQSLPRYVCRQCALVQCLGARCVEPVGAGGGEAGEGQESGEPGRRGAYRHVSSPCPRGHAWHPIGGEGARAQAREPARLTLPPHPPLDTAAGISLPSPPTTSQPAPNPPPLPTPSNVPPPSPRPP